MENMKRIFDGKNTRSDRSKAFWLWLRWGEEGYPPETWNLTNWHFLLKHAPLGRGLPPSPPEA